MNKMFRFVRTSRAKVAAVGASLMLPVLAMAQEADPAITAINNAKTNGLAVAAALVGLVIAVWAALYVKGFFGRK